MAITIDLLPGYVGLKRWFKRLLILSLLILATTGGVLFAVYYKTQKTFEKHQKEKEAIAPFASQAQTVEGQVAAANAETAPMASAVSFMADASKTGPERAALLNLIRQYIYYRPGRGAVVSLMDISDGTNLRVTATMETTRDYHNFLYKLRSGSATRTPPGPLFAADPVASGVPGFGNEQGPGGQASTQPGAPAAPLSSDPYIKALRLNIDAQGPLKNPIRLPADPGGDAAPAGGAAGGGGYPGGSGGGYPGS